MIEQRVTEDGERQQLVWYAAYGTNLRRERFACYLRGGRPERVGRTYAGCRDASDPRAEGTMRFAGRIAFGGESSVWTGGMAFVDCAGRGEVAARTYLITLEQLSDVVSQEIRRIPGQEIPLDVVRSGGPHGLGPGRYDTVLNLGERAGHPVVTITTSELPPPAPPAEGYVWTMAVGLLETFGLDGAEIADYLAKCVGMEGVWPRERLLTLATAGAA
jgi:hypothetical protein